MTILRVIFGCNVLLYAAENPVGRLENASGRDICYSRALVGCFRSTELFIGCTTFLAYAARVPGVVIYAAYRLRICLISPPRLDLELVSLQV
jgi:hypothetical protein